MQTLCSRSAEMLKPRAAEARAVPYAQRVYNVYRGYPEIAAEAYWMSALQFERLGDPVIAYKTLDEMLSNPRIAELPIAAAAESKRSALLKLCLKVLSKKPPPKPPRTTWRSANDNFSAQILSLTYSKAATFAHDASTCGDPSQRPAVADFERNPQDLARTCHHRP